MTRNLCLSLLAAAALAAGCAQATPEQQIVNDAVAAVGGQDRIAAVNTLVLEGEGTQYNLGQDVAPGASSQTFTVSSYRRAVDVAGGRARTEVTRTANFTYFAGAAPQRQVMGIDGTVGYNVAPTGAATRVAEPMAKDRRAEILHHPITALRAALDPMATLSNARTEGGESLVDVTAGGQMFTLVIDSTTKLPTRVITTTYNTNLGDVAITTSFSEYAEVDGLQLPSRLETKVDDFTIEQVRLTRQAVDGETGDLAAPAEVAKADTSVPPVNVAVEELARGVWRLGGGSHHSVLVEFADHLTLIEAPQNDARALAVIRKARDLRPDKPLTHVVNSHHHFDHSGGIRAAVSEGLTVITHKGNAAFFEEVVKRTHTTMPDALSANAKPLKVEAISERTELTDGRMTVNLYPISGPHSETMLIAYFPRERLLVESDVYSQGRAVHPFGAQFLDTVKTLNLRIDRVVPLHGEVVTYAQFVKDVTAAPAGTN